MTKEEIILMVIIAVIGSSALNGIVTHLLYNNKLKKELKSKGNDLIAREIQKSLQTFRDLELELTTIEIYDIEGELNTHGSNVDFFNSEAIYPAIFNDWESYNKFFDQISTCRKSIEKNLSCKLALNLVFIDRYITQLSIFLSENGNEDALPFWGTIFIFDLQNWQKKIDKLLIKEINKYSYTLESHETRKWNYMRNKELGDRFKDCVNLQADVE